MALTDESGNGGMIMPVTPMGGNGWGGGFGGDFMSWIVLFLIFGMFGGGYGGFGGGFGGGLGYDFPWLLNGQNGINANTNAGFAQAATQSAINGLQNSVTAGFGDVQLGIAGVNQNVCQTGNGIVNALNGGFANAETAANARQIANMQQAFNAQTGVTAAINGVQNAVSNSGYQTNAGIADLKYTVAQENCADRYEAVQNTRDIMENCNRNNQAILDKLCQLELDGVKGQLAQAQRENIGLQNQLNMATMSASQAAQTATFQQGLTNEVDALYNRLKNCPVPSMPVYGSQPIFTCPTSKYGCGCDVA